MLFRPIRTLIVIVIAFMAGLLFERSRISDSCATAGGTMLAGLCRGAQ
ncbi:hypothetical protein KX928_15980 [Roseobacter sp. YSTF-M11]|uniref:Uncharacterized protein n=1 Tax=Roseobacter insulae TaxID=2859783 RepID=A0A9X1JZE6_9RHOB|nr:hypothetical protein [Roseobacter insulae]MBW4709291.1 hypothetical protein [Roseobacter insulae]